MAVSLGKRILKWTLLVTPWLLTIILAAGWGLFLWTPGYLEKLVPQMAGEMGLPLTEFHIRNAGLFSADIGPVRLGPEKGGLRLANMHVTYTPESLKQKRVNTVTLEGVSLDAEFADGTFRLPVLDLLPKSESDTSSDNALPDLPLDSIAIIDSVLHCTVDGTPISVPFSALVTPGDTINVAATIIPRDQQIDVAVELGPTMDDVKAEVIAKKFRLGAVADFLPMPVTGDADITINAALNLTDLDSLNAQVQTDIANLVLPDTGVLLAEDSKLSIAANVVGKTVDFSIQPLAIEAPQPMTVTIAKGHASAENLATEFTIESMGVTLPGKLNATCTNDIWNVALNMDHPDKMVIDTGGRAIRLAGLNLSLTGTATSDKADVILKGNTRGTALDKTDLRTGAVKFSLPLAWPAPKKHTRGDLRVSDLRFDKYRLGTVVTRMRQQGMGLGIEGALYSQLLPDLKVVFGGSASMETKDARFTFDIPSYSIADTFDPATLAPAMKGVKLTGNLSVEGGLTIHDGDIASNMGVFVTNGSLVMGEEKTARLEGIRLYFESPDLMNFRSAPAQLLSFDSLTAGPLSIGKGRVTFQLEPRGVVLVENMSFNWVGGHVASRAFRIVPGHEEYDVTLFCSHLSLSGLLKQLGLADAEGKAALSGELPVTWKRGKISFNNGFLHSSPGEGGTIKVEAMQDLVSAIPEGTPQRGQLELAQEAIKDFEYRWVRIKADTVGKDLLVRLSLDGKPVSTLPFIYRKEFGGFARVTGDVKGSNFQGLRLDVNFTLPLDQILLYKDIINMIE
ncbi:YdbH domain-containing protein [Pseudodesulfovibrio sp. zrk46]|uniref:intermembrane phospholipid transport protein YdbH family protein n=1 Tax=Pseudodesulfovibrio sp. zrk46 TaxID=2725288 RepID=UPI001449617B|nr:YdbH domain-containing protein [Pseudodesulfovibrio sp. zrk46]QJB56628.1 hypothetical protein HFN16_09510 [Pseudodesulfovibrio sp. zrk46]